MATFEIRDANGKLQFDNELLTYALKRSGTATVADRRVGNTSPQSLTVPNTAGSTGLLALGGGGGYGAAFAGIWGQTGERIFATNAPAGTVFNYYLFERSATIPSSSFGIEIRNAANEITYSSNQRVMSALTIINEGGGVSYTGKTLAFSQGAWAGHRIAAGIRSVGGGGGGGDDLPNPDDGGGSSGTRYDYRNDGKVYGGCVLDNGQTVSTRQLSWDDVQIRGGEYPPEDYVKSLSLFVVDVTGVPIGQTFF